MNIIIVYVITDLSLYDIYYYFAEQLKANDYRMIFSSAKHNKILQKLLLGRISRTQQIHMCAHAR
jgi:hypothetical protein